MPHLKAVLYVGIYVSLITSGQYGLPHTGGIVHGSIQSSWVPLALSEWPPFARTLQVPMQPFLSVRQVNHTSCHAMSCDVVGAYVWFRLITVYARK